MIWRRSTHSFEMKHPRMRALFACAVLAAASQWPHALHAQTPPVAQRPVSTRVGVLPLDAAGTVEALGYALAEVLARDLSISSRLVVVERSRLDAVLRELGLATSGRVAPANAPRAGQLVGAERLFVGRIGASGNNEASIEIMSTDVATGQQTAVFAERVPFTGIIDVQERIAERAFNSLRITLTPAERDRVARRPTRNLEALVAFGHGRKLEAMGNPGQAAAYYAEARRLDPLFTMAELAPDAARMFVDISPLARSGGATDLSSQGEWLASGLVTTVLDQVIRPVGPGGTCPPTCPVVPATLIVRIVR